MILNGAEVLYDTEHGGYLSLTGKSKEPGANG